MRRLYASTIYSWAGFTPSEGAEGMKDPVWAESKGKTPRSARPVSARGIGGSFFFFFFFFFSLPRVAWQSVSPTVVGDTCALLVANLQRT